MFTGTYIHSLDTKGRVIIPAAYRKELGETFYITKSVDACVAVYTAEEWNKLKEKMDTLPKITSAPARLLKRLYFANSVLVEPDSQGRILIPAPLRESTGLSKDVTLAGVDDHVEIWDSERWSKENGAANSMDLALDLNGFVL